MTLSRGRERAQLGEEAAAFVIALSPSHGRALCAVRPRNVTVAWIEPTQPRCSLLSDGSRHTARSTLPSSGSRSSTGPSSFSAKGPSSRA